MTKPKKGVIPPQLRKYLFKRGKRSRVKKAKKAKRSRFSATRAIARIQSARLALNRKLGRKRAKNPSGYSRRHVGQLRRSLARTRRADATKVRRVYGIITARKGGTLLHFDGKHFSKAHAARKFPTLADAESTAKRLLKAFPILRSYAIEVRLSH